MKKHLYKFLSALFVVGILATSASAAGAACTTAPKASLKSFDCTALLGQLVNLQTGGSCQIKLPNNLGQQVKAATSSGSVQDCSQLLALLKDCFQRPYTGTDCGKAPSTGTDCGKAPCTGTDCDKAPSTGTNYGKAPCTGTDCDKAPCTGADCDKAPCTGTDCDKTPCTGADCDKAPCTGTDCDKAPCTGTDCNKTPVTTPPATETPATETPATETPATETPVTETPATATPSSISAYEMEVINLVNKIRTENGLGTLKASEKLSEIARTKSQDMRTNGYFAHQSPTYGSPFDMLHQFGVNYRTAGENIAYGYATPAAVVEGWMNSQGHRENILKSTYTEIGVGYVESGHYWTQLFTG